MRLRPWASSHGDAHVRAVLRHGVWRFLRPSEVDDAVEPVEAGFLHHLPRGLLHGYDEDPADLHDATSFPFFSSVCLLLFRLCQGKCSFIFSCPLRRAQKFAFAGHGNFQSIYNLCKNNKQRGRKFKSMASSSVDGYEIPELRRALDKIRSLYGESKEQGKPFDMFTKVSDMDTAWSFSVKYTVAQYLRRKKRREKSPKRATSSSSLSTDEESSSAPSPPRRRMVTRSQARKKTTSK